MSQRYPALKWMLYLSVAGFALSCAAPLVAPGASLADVAKFAFPLLFFALVLYVFLLNRGAVSLWIPSLRFVLGAAGMLVVLGGAIAMAVCEIPIDTEREAIEYKAAELPAMETKLKEDIPAEERQQIEETLAYWKENDGYSEQRIAEFHQYQMISAAVAGGGMLLFLLSFLLPAGTRKS